MLVGNRKQHIIPFMLHFVYLDRAFGGAFGGAFLIQHFVSDFV